MRNWHAVYDENTRLIHSLYRRALINPSGFTDTLERVNSFLEKKRIVGFDDDLNLMVETDLGGKHNVYALSTGEKQALILIAFTNRWLKPGGILLVDEPDLYMHPSWIEQIVRVLSNLARERGGQFIFASHSPIVWDNFPRDADQIRMEIKTQESSQVAEPPAPNQGARKDERCSPLAGFPAQERRIKDGSSCRRESGRNRSGKVAAATRSRLRR